MSFRPQLMGRFRLLHDAVRRWRMEGEARGGRRCGAEKWGSGKDSERTGQEEDRRGAAEGGLDR